MSDTPRVDEAEISFPVAAIEGGDIRTARYVDADFARILERDAAALRKELAEVTAAFQAVCDHDFVKEDHSFDHAFGTEVIRFLRCEKCGKNAEWDDVPHNDDDGPDPDVQRDRDLYNP